MTKLVSISDMLFKEVIIRQTDGHYMHKTDEHSSAILSHIDTYGIIIQHTQRNNKPHADISRVVFLPWHSISSIELNENQSASTSGHTRAVG